MNKAPDSYESRYMGADGAVVHGKKRMPPWFFLLFAAIIAACVGAAVASGSLASLVLAPFFVVVALLFAVLRLVVTREHLHVQMGLWGPKIAIKDITRIEVADYDFMRYGGWGIRLGIDGSWAYSIPGGSGRGVRVEWRVGDTSKSAFVSCEDADEVVRAVRELQRSAVDPTGVRVLEPTAEASQPADAPAAAAAASDRRQNS